MSRGKLDHGVVSIPALDVRRRPDHRSEMRSQLLLGEVVRRLGKSPDGAWWRVRNASDGYEGWVRTWGLVPASAARALRWKALARARVSVPTATAFSSPGRGTAVGPLYLNSRVILERRKAGHARVELPDGRRGWVRRSALRATNDAPARLTDRIRSLLGTPYLWGGRTPQAFDCSGFAQQVLAEQGVRLPRDAWQQRSTCERLGSRESMREGDLLFFGPPHGRVAHVGISLGLGYFADCRGVVRIASVDERNPLCDRELMRQYRGAGRPQSRTE
jgi:cell wall-associated NlpC family hydrolase